MLIGFKERFVDLILSEKKIHTIRKDESNRYQPGKTLHMATGIRTKKCNIFLIKRIIKTQPLRVVREENKVYFFLGDKRVSRTTADRIAKNDGFKNSTELVAWIDDFYSLPFDGKLIHWTKKIYRKSASYHEQIN